MIEVGYRYCDLDKTHEYSVMSEAVPASWNQWLWHWLKFKHTKNVRLLPYHCTYSKTKILARYRGASAKTVAGHISKRIERHIWGCAEKARRKKIKI